MTQALEAAAHDVKIFTDFGKRGPSPLVGITLPIPLVLLRSTMSGPGPVPTSRVVMETRVTQKIVLTTTKLDPEANLVYA